jgi:cyclohexyl-isocyanide hydratase
MHIGLLLFPRLTQLDLTGPYEVFVRTPGTMVHLIWKTLSPVMNDRNMAIVPTVTFSDCPALDVICVPGGPRQMELMEDEETLSFLRRQATQAKWVTSVCTGSLVLGAAGLLKGYKATCHWSSRDQLSLFGAVPVDARVVIDRNRITGGGITAGIDFALVLAAILTSEEKAKIVQLGMEYDPAPPFSSGSPNTADPSLVEHVRGNMAAFIARRLVISQRAAAKLKSS